MTDFSLLPLSATRRPDERVSKLLQLVVFAAAVVWMIGVPVADVAASEPSIEAMLDNRDDEEVPDADAALPESTVSEVNVDVHWRNWSRGLSDGNIGEEILEDLYADAVAVGMPTLPYYQMAVLHEAQRAEEYGLDDQEVFELQDIAHTLAPHLPYARLELSRTRLLGGLDSAHRSVMPFVEGLQLGYQWLDTRIGWALKIVLIFLMATGVVFFGFLLAQLLRYFGIAAYDGTRVLPRGFSSTQTVILLVALVLVPGLLLQSPLISMLLLLALVIPFQQLNERLVSIGFLTVLGLLPFIDELAGEFVMYPDSDAQQVLHAHYHGCDDECRSWLDSIADDDHSVARYVERVATYRDADPEQMQQLEAWFDQHDPAAGADRLEGHWHNLHGAVLIARGEADRAVEVLGEATRADSSLPSAWFNKGRAHQLLDEQASSGNAMQRAFARDLDGVARHADLDERDPNSFLMLGDPDSTTVWHQHRPGADEAPSLIEPVWTVVAGEDLELDIALWIGLGGVLFVLATTQLYVGRRVSSPCPKCGLARDPTETAETGNHHYCLPCYQTFVSGASMDYHARVHSEATLGRRDRLQNFLRRALSVVAPGVGHVLGGHAIRGVLAFGLLMTGIFILMYPHGPVGAWRGPFELFHEHWAGQAVFAWVLVVIGGIVGISGLWNGIRPTRIDEAPPDNGGPR